MPAPDQGALDPTAVRAFVRMVHDAAARALEGAADPGMLQLSVLHPGGTTLQTTRFPIGAVDAMADTAISAAEGGLNVYTEGRTVDARAARRGDANATRGVFALIDDSDGDKGKGGVLPVKPTWIVESSPGNRHSWFVLDRALVSDEARPIGAAMRKAIGSDSATGRPEQPFRVPGTPNYPDAKKRARGRVTSPTRVLDIAGPLWSGAALAEAFPPAPERETEASTSSGGRSGATSATFDDLIAEKGDDRSTRFHEAVKAAFKAGLLRGDAEDAMRRHPGGCAGKYLKPDRLAEEIARSWGKVEAKAAQEAEAAAAGVDPTYPDRAVSIDEARAAVRDAIAAHFTAGTGHRAIRIGTGIGKTRAAARAVAEDVRRRRGEGDRGAALYLVPTHKLGEEVAELFRSEGVTARVFRGRNAQDPEAIETDRRMCLDTEAVDLALSLGRTVSTSCCKAKHPKTGTMMHCASYSDCAYQRQIRDRPDVWVAASDLLFSAPTGLGHVSTVVVDEGFWGTGIRIGTRGISLDEVGAPPPLGRNNFEMMQVADVAAWRAQLGRALARQEGLGGFERKHLVAEGIDVDLCTSANRAEWRLKDKVEMWPGMGQQARRAALRLAETAVKVGRVAPVWKAARELLRVEDPDAVSGRLVLAEATAEDGFGKTRVVRTHGVRKVLDRWLDVPVLVLDATLPSLDVLRAFLPEVEVTAEVEATTPHARVRQVLGAPVSAGKLMGSRVGRNREAIRRAVLHRFVQAGRCSTLVIVQKEAAEWLRSSGLPAEITVAHYGAIAGLDGFKGVGLLIAIGRTMPTVTEVETYAGAISGLDPLRTAEAAKGPRWYDRTILGIRLARNVGRAVQGDRHPDPTAEAVRWQIAEGGVMQAIGRARAVNRTAADPVTIEIWNDLVLPMTVDEVVAWDTIPSGHEADMLADGVVLESPSDMARCWPEVWETAETAKQWLKRTTRCQNPIRTTRCQNPIRDHHRDLTPCAFRYRHPGERQKWRSGWHDPAVCPDPRTWLEARLGVLPGFEMGVVR